MELVLQTIVLSILAGLYLFFILPNWFYLDARAPRTPLPERLPKISVLIPARNEEAHIGRCLETLLEETYPNFEVLVLDDNSTDRTAEIALSFAARDKRLKVLSGLPLPQGWAGKPHACHELSLAASGEYLLFTDADTTFRPGLLDYSLRMMLHHKADLLSGFPRLWSPCFAGRLIMPNVFLLYFALMPLYLMSSKFFGRLAFASGAYLFFRAESYRLQGGHAAIRTELTEDVALAREAKKAGFRFRLIDPSRFIASKMYENFREVWTGYGKSIYKALGSSPLVLLGFLFLLWSVFLAPFYHLGVHLMNSSVNLSFWLVILQIALALQLRLMISRRYQLSWESVLLHPVSILALMAIAIDSGLRGIRGKGYEWKGRKLE